MAFHWTEVATAVHIAYDWAMPLTWIIRSKEMAAMGCPGGRGGAVGSTNDFCLVDPSRDSIVSAFTDARAGPLSILRLT